MSQDKPMLSEPTLAEIREQLRKILESAIFAGARPSTRLAQLLIYLVETAIDNKPLDEETIGINVYGRTERWCERSGRQDTIVRSNLHNLRNKLKEYYATMGINDSVHISIQGYRPKFAYTHLTPSAIAYRRGIKSLDSFPSPHDVHTAVENFRTAIASDPTHAKALARLAESICNLSWYASDKPPVDLLNEANSYAQQAVALAPKSWDAHLAIGIVALCSHDWNKADAAFRKAIELDEIPTRNHFWFTSYLDVKGDFPEAVKTSRIKIELEPDNPVRLVTHVFSLYFGRQYEEAEALCREALALDRHNFRGHGVMCFVSLALRKFEQALTHSQILRTLSGSDIYSGLEALCFAYAGDHRSARQILDRLEDASYYVTNFQLALAYMGLDEFDKAITALERGYDDCDPWLIYLHLIPVFDPLRGHERFKALIRRLNLPVI